MLSQKFSAQAGIAIGPILFILAILALIGTVLAAGGGGFSTAGTTDRISADIQSQATLIQSKIGECNIKYGTNNNYDGYPTSDTVNGTPVSALNCEGDPVGMQNIWTGLRPASLPPPTNGFNNWMYINTNGGGMGGDAAGGRCIWITPNVTNASGNQGMVSGLAKAASKFTNGRSYVNTNEVIYNPESPSQKFVLWITLPTGLPDSHCLP